MPGSLRSVSTRSTGPFCNSLRPVSASPADRVSKPSSARFSSKSRRILASSSTIRMVAFEVVISVIGAAALLSRCPLRKEDHEAGSVSVHVLQSAGRVVLVNNLRNDRQAKADAGFLRRDKRIENLVTHLCRDARPAIPQPDLDSVATIRASHRNL